MTVLCHQLSIHANEIYARVCYSYNTLIPSFNASMSEFLNVQVLKKDDFIFKIGKVMQIIL